MFGSMHSCHVLLAAIFLREGLAVCHDMPAFCIAYGVGVLVSPLLFTKLINMIIIIYSPQRSIQPEIIHGLQCNILLAILIIGYGDAACLDINYADKKQEKALLNPRSQQDQQIVQTSEIF